MLAALVPSEALGTYAVLLSFTTDTVKNEAGEAVTTVTAPGTLEGVCVALLVLSAVLYIVTHHRPQGSLQVVKMSLGDPYSPLVLHDRLPAIRVNHSTNLSYSM